MSGKSRFKPKTRKYNIGFAADHDLYGLEICMRAMRLGELEKLGSMAEEFKLGDADEVAETLAAEEGNGGKQSLELLGGMIDRLAKVLVSWNRMDEDTMRYNEETEEYEETEETKLLPATADGLRRLEDWEFMAILDGYMRAVVGVSADLGKGSSSGQQSLGQLPMTEL